MKKPEFIQFVCPECKKNLTIDTVQNHLNQEFYICENKHIFKCQEGIIDFTLMSEKDKNEYAINLFKNKANSYDQFQHLSFELFNENEQAVRNKMIDKLNLNEKSKVLEVNAGTGRDSVLIASRLSQNGELHLQDISIDMLRICKEKIEKLQISSTFHQGNASKLPYPDKTFDALYSFGGIGMNTYSDNKEAIKELVRVVKNNGRIVFGGLSLAPWLKHSNFGKILINHNEHYANEINFNDLPIESREVSVEWILSGAGFVIDFRVEHSEPTANFDMVIPGERGGTLNTRYFGKLEGVTPEVKQLALKARSKINIPMHDWLNEIIKNASEKALKE